MPDALSKSENLKMDCEQCSLSVTFYCDPLLHALSSEKTQYIFRYQYSNALIKMSP